VDRGEKNTSKDAVTRKKPGSFRQKGERTPIYVDCEVRFRPKKGLNTPGAATLMLVRGQVKTQKKNQGRQSKKKSTVKAAKRNDQVVEEKDSSLGDAGGTHLYRKGEVAREA